MSQAKLREALAAGAPPKEKGPPVIDGVLSETPDTPESIEWRSRQSIIDTIASSSTYLENEGDSELVVLFFTIIIIYVDDETFILFVLFIYSHIIHTLNNSNLLIYYIIIQQIVPLHPLCMASSHGALKISTMPQRENFVLEYSKWVHIAGTSWSTHKAVMCPTISRCSCAWLTTINCCRDGITLPSSRWRCSTKTLKNLNTPTPCTDSARKSTTGGGRSSWSWAKCRMGSLWGMLW